MKPMDPEREITVDPNPEPVPPVPEPNPEPVPPVPKEGRVTTRHLPTPSP